MAVMGGQAFLHQLQEHQFVGPAAVLAQITGAELQQRPLVAVVTNQGLPQQTPAAAGVMVLQPAPRALLLLDTNSNNTPDWAVAYGWKDPLI